MKNPHSSIAEAAPWLAELVNTACAMEARQRQMAMGQDDLRVQETAAELIFIAGEDLGPTRAPEEMSCLS